jgi:hypothetical protein
MNADEVIDALGGNSVIAKAIGVGRSAISMWRATGIPTARCLVLAQLARDRGVPGVTAEVLLSARPAPLPPVQKGKTYGDRPRSKVQRA